MEGPSSLVWLRAEYAMHSFAYRDPRAAFSVASGLPVVSPTAVLLGMVSTLFSIGDEQAARQMLAEAHKCEVLVEAPGGIVFFRAFHQLRRYETDKNNRNNPRLGLTKINQGTREYGLPQGHIVLWVRVPHKLLRASTMALVNRDHIGTHDSLCSLVGDVEERHPTGSVLYRPLVGDHIELPAGIPCTVVTLSRFKAAPIQQRSERWYLAGGDDTELVPYLIPGRFVGTRNGKVYLNLP